MKKIIAFFLTLVFLTSMLSVAFASGDDEGISENSSSFSCAFNSEKNIIEIKGTVNHDILVKYGSYTISVYKIPFGISDEEALSDIDNRVISNAAITIKYEFAIQVTSVMDRFVKYVVALCSPSGDVYPASSAKIPVVYGNYEYDEGNRTFFKGIETTEVAAASNASPATAIIELNLDMLYGNASNCYLYPMGDTYAYLDKSVISDIDSQVMALSQSGSRVYLRFLLSSKGDITAISGENSTENTEETYYTIPDVYNKETLDFICAAASFMADRYCRPDKTQVHGIVLGTQMDDVESVNSNEAESFEEYIDRYVIYMLAVAKSIRTINSDIDIVVPISDINDYSIDTASDTSKSADFLEGITKRLNEYVLDEPIFSVMIEVKNAPFNISNSNLNKGINVKSKNSVNNRISVENIEIFDEFFDKLSDGFDNAPLCYSVLWSVPEALSGNALTCAYAYSYYKLFSFANVSSFIVSLAEGEGNGIKKFDEISLIFKYINTTKTFDYTDNLLKYFGTTSWSKLLDVESSDAYSVKNYYEMSKSSLIPENKKGSFDYFEFDSSVNTSRWKNGINTKNAKFEYFEDGSRALHITSVPLECGEYFEIYHIYDIPENFEYTPYLSFDLFFDGNEDKNVFFEVNVILGNENSIAYASHSFKSGERHELILDASEFNDGNNAEYLKISIRPLSENNESVSVWLNSVKGYSEEYNDEELSNYIKVYRLNAQDDTEDSNDADSAKNNIFTVLGICIAVISIGVGLFIVFKRDE